jgi:hypothetical protein
VKTKRARDTLKRGDEKVARAVERAVAVVHVITASDDHDHGTVDGNG